MNGHAADFVRELRRRAALSQRALADAAGTSQSVVGRIEAGLTHPTVESLERLAHAAGFGLRLECVPLPVADPVIAAYAAGVDRSLLRANLRKSPRERFAQLLAARRFILKARRVGAAARESTAQTSRRVAEPKHRYRVRDDE